MQQTPTGDRKSVRRVQVLGSLAMVTLFMAGVAQGRRADPDMWHEMALIREAAEIGRLPTDDVYAYTPTVSPVVHHEWGTGAILFWLGQTLGAPGILGLRMVLALTLAGCAVGCARRRGASPETLLILVPVAVLMTWIGFSPVRAQQFTMCFLAVLLWMIDGDRNGRRAWIGPWLILFVFWLNLHAGFAVSIALLGLHTLEQAIKRQPFLHLPVVLAAMCALIALNPYGTEYYPYLWRAISMQRGLITEWQPMWQAWWLIQVFFGFSLLLLVYAIARRGWRDVPGMPLLLALGYQTLMHQRHAVLYAIAWVCYVPGLLSTTPLQPTFSRLLYSRPRASLAAWSMVVVVGVYCFATARPWQLGIPANPGDDDKLTYPVGAVQYLRDQGFRGNLMVPFGAGAFVLWKLHPNVLISLDSRYEVAYATDVLPNHRRFYEALDGWKAVLDEYDTDLVLVPRTERVAAHMPVPGWARVYQDDAFDIHARQPHALPNVDRTGERLVGTFDWRAPRVSASSPGSASRYR